jgi:glycosyltransferase involved in cell wall biosynthesis
MSPVRVCAVTFDWFPFEPRAFRLIRAAADAGCEVDVVCLRQTHQKYYEVDNGVHIYRVPLSRGHGGSLLLTVLRWCWFFFLAGATVTRLHLRRRYDIVQVHNMPDFFVFAALLPRLMGAKVVLDVQDACPELMAEKVGGPLREIAAFLASAQERISTAFADHVITVGWTLEELLLKRGVPREKISSIFNSADPKIFPASHRAPAHPIPGVATDKRPFVLVYHGSVERRQGLDTAIRAVALARSAVPEICLCVKGFGEAADLRRLVVELGLEGVVVFSRRCPVGEVADFLACADVGIIPYRGGGYMELVLPTKAFEFARMRCPMIASNLRGIRSLFRPGSIALCEPSCPASFAEAIIDLYQHPEKRLQMAARAAEDYQLYRWELMAERYQKLLETLSGKQVHERFAAALEAQEH